MLVGLLVVTGCLIAGLVGVTLGWKELGYSRGQMLGREYFALANHEWRQGHFLTALQRAGYGIRTLIDSEWRWQIAQPYVREYEIFRQQGRDPQALQACQRAVALLQPYESEGGIGTDCYMLQRQLMLPPNTEHGQGR